MQKVNLSTKHNQMIGIAKQKQKQKQKQNKKEKIKKLPFVFCSPFKLN
jgi:hypothetical protein